jgi:hypothetical protein
LSMIPCKTFASITRQARFPAGRPG